MQEQHRFAVCTGLGLAVAERPGARLTQAVASRPNIGDLVTNMVYPALGMALDKSAHRRIRPAQSRFVRRAVL